VIIPFLLALRISGVSILGFGHGRQYTPSRHAFTAPICGNRFRRGKDKSKLRELNSLLAEGVPLNSAQAAVLYRGTRE
jgi:hypothetical protein